MILESTIKIAKMKTIDACTSDSILISEPLTWKTCCRSMLTGLGTKLCCPQHSSSVAAEQISVHVVWLF